MANSAYVSTGKPKKGGAVYRAPLGTTLPTSTDDVLSADWKDVGYVSEDGFTNSNTRESEAIKAWGGDTVLESQTNAEDKWQGAFIESLNPEVLKMVFGENNVTGSDINSGINIVVNSEEAEEASYVIDMIMRGGVLKRVVIPNGKLSELGDTVYKDNEPVAYEVTISALPDKAGNMHYEYIKKPASPVPPTPTPTIYSVTQNLTNVTSSTDITTIEENSTFEATLEAESGYTLDTVEVTMDGSDITSTAWDALTGKVTIDAVTGDLVITATAA